MACGGAERSNGRRADCTMRTNQTWHNRSRRRRQKLRQPQWKADSSRFHQGRPLRWVLYTYFGDNGGSLEQQRPTKQGGGKLFRASIHFHATRHRGPGIIFLPGIKVGRRNFGHDRVPTCTCHWILRYGLPMPTSKLGLGALRLRSST